MPEEAAGGAAAAGAPTGVLPADLASRPSAPAEEESANEAPRSSFEYHKDAFPLDWSHDGATILVAAVGLMIAASGGIGGGGILVPVFMLVLGFKPKHAVALSNFTILGGAIANTAVNVRKRHPELNKPLIDWDLILIMEPLTIFGAVFGSLISKVIPNAILTVSLVLILAVMARHTLKKGVKMWCAESRRSGKHAQDCIEMPAAGAMPGDICPDTGSDLSYLELQSESESVDVVEASAFCKVGALVVCFVGICALTLLKGGGNFPSPLGFECGSLGFWLLYFGAVPWVLAFAAVFRCMLVGEFQRKVQQGHVFAQGEVLWDAQNTIKYPLYCAVAGLMAGLFGVGGGIVKGPLMLEMGIAPPVAAASAATMILFTAAAASTSFVVFGLLHPAYGAVFFLLGLVSTAVGQYGVGSIVKRFQRESLIVLCIGLVIALSSLLMGLNAVSSFFGPTAAEMFQAHGVCNSEA